MTVANILITAATGLTGQATTASLLNLLLI